MTFCSLEAMHLRVRLSRAFQSQGLPRLDTWREFAGSLRKMCVKAAVFAMDTRGKWFARDAGSNAHWTQ